MILCARRLVALLIWTSLLPYLAGVPADQAPIKPNAIVAGNGSGQFKTVQEAINAAPQTTNPANRWVILIKPGTYKELIYVQREKRFVQLLGEDPVKTIITYDLNANIVGKDGKPIGTFRTPSTLIDADDFTAQNLTFENSAGPVGQALAIRVDGDRVAFRNCRFLGWQDTILINRGRQYFEDCYIAGHVDFIFGGATAWFEKCHIHCLRDGYITAASTPENQPFGFVFSNCTITGESPEVKTYLGRPWRPFASVTFLRTEMSAVVRPVGWHNWNQPDRERTARYSEFGSKGPGGNLAERVAWSRQLKESEAQSITLAKAVGGIDGWDPKDALRIAPGFASVQSPAPSASVSMHEGLIADIEYGRAEGQRLMLDASAPEGSGPFPVAIIVHGGGWSGGDKKTDHTPLLMPLIEAEFAWFSINYRLVPDHKWPACLEDVRTAIR